MGHVVRASNPFDPGRGVNEDGGHQLGPDRIRSATAWRFSYLAIQGGSSLALFVALGRALSTDAFSPCAVALGLLVIVQTLGDFGLSQALVTDLPARVARLGRHGGDAGAAQELRGAAARAVFFAGGAALVFGLAGALLVPHEAMLSVVLVAPAAAAGVLLAGADGLLRGAGDFRRPVFLLIVGRVLSFAGVPVAAMTDSAEATTAALTVGTLLGSLPVLLFLVPLALPDPRASVADVFRASLPLGISQLFVLGGGRVDTLLLGTLSTLTMAAVFEGVWRVYQLGQYLAGGVATALAPFIATAMGDGRHLELERLLRRALFAMLGCGIVWAAAMYLGRQPIGRVLLEGLRGDVAEALIPLALVTPIAFTGYLSTTTLASRAGERRFIVVAHAAGALVNVALVVILVGSHGAVGAATACAIGLGITNLALTARCLVVLRQMRHQALQPSRVSVR